MSTALSIPSALYAVSQFDWNGFIIALINRDKHRPHDRCCEHTLSLPLAQFVIILFLISFFLCSLPLYCVFGEQLVLASLPATPASASTMIWSVMAGTTVVTWVMKWSAVSFSLTQPHSFFPLSFYVHFLAPWRVAGHIWKSSYLPTRSCIDRPF